MSEIKSALDAVKTNIPSHVELVAVSKTKPLSALNEAYAAGQRHFGENKSIEILEKAPSLPSDIKWHFIGHLQSKKVKQILPHTHLIHSVDSEKLLVEINKRAASLEKTQDVLLQIHIAQEEHKFGLNEAEAKELIIKSREKLPNVRICGLMGMATFTDNQPQLKQEFTSLKELFDTFQTELMSDQTYFKEISMGMSGDYQLAIDCGSTMVRVGSSIFGSRNYG